MVALKSDKGKLLVDSQQAGFGSTLGSRWQGLLAQRIRYNEDVQQLILHVCLNVCSDR